MYLFLKSLIILKFGLLLNDGADVIHNAEENATLKKRITVIITIAFLQKIFPFIFTPIF